MGSLLGTRGAVDEPNAAGVVEFWPPVSAALGKFTEKRLQRRERVRFRRRKAPDGPVAAGTCAELAT